MEESKNFYSSANALARNPLGVIALFIVMVYAVASVVIGLAKGEFYAHPLHPSVLFLTGFPLVVLGAFVYLVGWHHEKLYAPGDYKNQADFMRTVRAPSAVRGVEIGVATSDKTNPPPSLGVTEQLNSSYTRWLDFGYCLVHEAAVIQPRTAPKTGRFRLRVWIEPIQDKSLKEIESVTYRVWDDFDEPILQTSDEKSNFDLWLNVYGEFPVIALVKTKAGQVFELQRYLDLPTRPQD